MLKSQKELKAVYTEELKKAWDWDRMVKYCSNSTAFVIEHNGALYGIEKPKIKTRFCFSYGFCGVSSEEEEQQADNMAETARKSKEYFINQNLEELNRWIKSLQKILDDMGKNWAEGSHPQYMIETGEHYSGQKEDCRLRYYSIVDTFDGTSRGEICNDTELIKKLIAGYEEVKKQFEKRLNTYLKRYGLSKIDTWSFLSD